jgi:hypothetical protein
LFADANNTIDFAIAGWWRSAGAVLAFGVCATAVIVIATFMARSSIGAAFEATAARRLAWADGFAGESGEIA